MKTKIIILCLFIFISTIFTQQWTNNYTFTENGEITQMQFINANIGWATFKSGTHISMYRTTNRGQNWILINEYNIYPYDNVEHTYFVFVNESIGYRTHNAPDNGGYTIVDKTQDGGFNWTRKITLYDNSISSLVGCLSLNEIYVFSSVRNNPWEVQVYKTTNDFNTWNLFYTATPSNGYRYILKDILVSDNRILVTGQRRNHGGDISDYLTFEYENGSIHPIIGMSGADYRFFHYSARINGQWKFLSSENTTSYSGTRFYNDYGHQNSVLINPIISHNGIGGFSFSDNSKGFMSINNLVYSTLNSGANWVEEHTLTGSSYSNNNAHHRVKSFGDVCYIITSPGYFHTRKISGNFNTNFDWTTTGTGSINVDGEVNVTTPNTAYYRGGNAILSAPLNLGSDTAARFYYWGGNCNGSMNFLGNSNYLINSNSAINADYKTKLRSYKTTSPLEDANQVKVLKDANGVTNLIYESMQGIFYTRTRPDGNFKAEEVLSGSGADPIGSYVTYNNTNPHLTEIQNAPTSETNMFACWERREGSNIKIMGSERVYNTIVPPGAPYHYWGTGELLTMGSITGDFKCYPKIMAAQIGSEKLKVLMYLQPDGSNKKIVAKVHTSNNYTQYFDITTAGNIQEYAIASSYSYSKFYVHLVYRKDQRIYYKQVRLGQETQWSGTYPWYDVLVQDQDISENQSRFRASLDISLKNSSNDPNNINMQPVVTYQGKIDVKIIIQNGDGLPQEVTGSKYPIYVKERLQSGQWAQSWVEYSSLNVQKTPHIVGSKLRNSCLLSYGREESGIDRQFQVVPRWNNSAPNTYFCVPNYFNGKDAKLQSGALVNESSTSQKLMTVTQNGSLFDIGIQPFTVTNSQIGIEDGYEYITGTVVNEGIAYSFNLGNIMVNWNTIGFSSDIDTIIEDTPDFNENLMSKPFLLNDNDTLVIGRNAFYIQEEMQSTEPLEIEYRVKLMNKTLDAMHQLLAIDTIHSGDTVQVEFLEGFIITGIPNGSDSFYVQMEIDTIDGNHGIGGGGDGDGDGGDSPLGNGIKRMVYWQNGNHTVKTNSLPTSFALHQNFPNPFNPVTVIKYDLPKDVKVTIRVYDLLGREVETILNNEFKTAGWYEANWNASKYASGVYIYRIEAGDFVSSKKMVLVK